MEEVVLLFFIRRFPQFKFCKELTQLRVPVSRLSLCYRERCSARSKP